MSKKNAKPGKKAPDKLTPKNAVLPPPAVLAIQLRDCDGNQAAVARLHGVTRQSVNDMVQKHPELQAACRDAREAMKDDAESSLYRAVKAGESWAVCFYLKTQAKDRGYIERQEHEHSGEVRRVTEVIVTTREEVDAVLSLNRPADALAALPDAG